MGYRRVIVTVAALLALALPALALASTGTRKYNGNFGSPGEGVEFKVHTKNGHAKFVKLFEFHNIPAYCPGFGTTATTGEFDMKMTIDQDKKFHGTGKVVDSNSKVTIHGRLKDAEKKARGTLHVTGPVSGCSNVDTGVVHWKAHSVK
jgi:hypothetical protein